MHRSVLIPAPRPVLIAAAAEQHHAGCCEAGTQEWHIGHGLGHWGGFTWSCKPGEQRHDLVPCISGCWVPVSCQLCHSDFPTQSDIASCLPRCVQVQTLQESVQASAPASAPAESQSSSRGAHPVSLSDSKTSLKVRYLPSLKMTTSSGSLRSLLLMKRSRCFWCMHALWCTWVSTCSSSSVEAG